MFRHDIQSLIFFSRAALLATYFRIAYRNRDLKTVIAPSIERIYFNDNAGVGIVACQETTGNMRQP